MSVSHRLPDHLARRLDSFGIETSAEQRHLLLELLEMLAKWNRVYNLTAVRNINNMVEHHVLDSLSLLPHLPQQSVRSDSQEVEYFDVMDMGSGAGFPTLPLAIMRPDLRFISIESNGKKTRFQQQVVLESGLSHVQVTQQRVQEARSRAHTVTSRAFTAPVEFLDIAEPHCLPDGQVIVMLGFADRLPAAFSAAFEPAEMQQIQIPGLESTRHLAICRKRSVTMR